MDKRDIKKSDLKVLERELRFLEDSAVIPAGTSTKIHQLYEVQRLSFTKTLLYVGSILIGAGILSFIASNWEEIGKAAKFLIILVLYTGANVAGYKMESHFPKTSRSFYYLGVIIFGAGLFLIEQMFHLGVSFQQAFLWWSLGILPIAWVLRDKWILLASSIFLLINIMDSPYMEGHVIPFWMILLIAVIYLTNEKIGFTNVTGFIIGLLSLAFIGTIISYFVFDNPDYPSIYSFIYLVIGILLVLAKEKGEIRDIYVVLGYIVHGTAAVILSFEGTWPADFDWAYIPFSILYLLFTLFLIKRGSLLSIIILCVMIFRFYLDISFDFLPKSFVFIIGGFLLLGFGFYFEKQRKKGGGFA
nr:DUF2157 domain-containing protein [Neobacillus sp. Marseille-Q6967]